MMVNSDEESRRLQEDRVAQCGIVPPCHIEVADGI